MNVEISGLQFFIMVLCVVVTPLMGLLLHRNAKNKKVEIIPEENKRKLNSSEPKRGAVGVLIRDIDWSSLYSGWLKGQALNFEKEKIPLICTLKGIEHKGAWSQPMKLGVNPLINVSKNYLEKFGKAVVTITSVSRDDVARNICWGLANYLNVVAGRILIFEINQKSGNKKPSARISIGNQLFDEIPDPRPSDISNVDVIAFDQAYTWPEDILTPDLLSQFVQQYRNIYPLIYIVTPPVIANGFARKAAACSDCCILIGSPRDDQPLLIDAYQRIKHSGREIENDTLVVWGIREK